jgi:hypothetical protein
MATTRYVQFGIYFAPAECLGEKLRCSSASDMCYLKMIERTPGQLTYTVHVAASLDALKDVDKAQVTTITPDQLRLAKLIEAPGCSLCANDLMSSPSRYVAPARILPAYLRPYACAQLIYFEPEGEGALDTDGNLPVRVVALAERLSNPKSPCFHITFGKEELRQAVLLTRELLILPTSDLRAYVEAFAAEATGTAFEHPDPIELMPNLATLSLEQLRAHHYHTNEDALFCLLEQHEEMKAMADITSEEAEEIEPVFVPQKVVKQVVAKSPCKEREMMKAATWQRKLVLRSALQALHLQMYLARDGQTRDEIRKRDFVVRSVLVNEQSSLYRRVTIEPAFSFAHRLAGYYVHIQFNEEILSETHIA